ncbi:uncharacterized protein LOC121789204 [Salvia splendens]|uniref:uncharacterized protein LOC121789204 n=1 Tax=Salvia splendens TaxID=180675 RepID=UPI001C26A05E|nr:uncharacterized protein LOC121789204 [Salvia splendens]
MGHTWKLWIKQEGGGVVRDWTGKLLAAFSTPLDAHSALEAELMVAHCGLELANELAQLIWMETDAEQVAKLLNGKTWGPAHVRRVMARLFLFKQQHIIRVSSIPREGNQAADMLAKMGLDQQSYLCYSAQSAPRPLKDIIRMEEMGIPNIRVRFEEHG